MKRIIYCKLINVIIALTAVTLSQAQTIIAPTSSKGSTSFAIITDQKTWQK